MHKARIRALFAHVKLRLEDRYGIFLTKGLHNEIVNMIKGGKSYHIISYKKDGCVRSQHCVLVHNKWVKLVYDDDNEILVTALRM